VTILDYKYEDRGGAIHCVMDEDFENSDFKAKFDSQNDVIYGTLTARDQYVLKYLFNEFCADFDDPKKAMFDDKFEDYAARWFNRRTPYINTYNETLSEVVFRDPTAVAAALNANMSALKHDKREYIRQLDSHTKLSPSQIHSRRQNRGKEDNAITPVTGLNPDQVAKLYYYISIRRACKFGIEFFATSAAQGKVHYVLDGITIQEVVNKTEYGLFGSGVSAQQNRTGVPITTSELRYLFRNWFSFSASQRNRIFFYRLARAVEPPWIENPGPWLDYARHRIGKLANSGPRLGEFDSRRSTPAEAMRIYSEAMAGQTV
jgi:hypothetical protein